jgi:hypothetical protein
MSCTCAWLRKGIKATSNQNSHHHSPHRNTFEKLNMYMPNLFLFTLLAVLSGVKGAAQQKWLCYCTIQGQYDPVATQKCCVPPGVLVGTPPPPVRTHSPLTTCQRGLILNLTARASMPARWHSSRGPAAKLH